MPDLGRLAGSVLCVGLAGPGVDAEERTELRALGPGAVVLFARNVTTLDATRRLLADARDVIGGEAPALGCVDQEGGRVVRLRFSAEAIPPMLALGATGDAALAERVGERLGDELRAVGANVDFAPVLDLALEPENTAIGSRSLGDDPARVALLGAAIIRGLQRRGVAATAKHFPGHGATALDSHLTLPVVAADAATLRARDLVPFAAAIAEGVRAVMTAHIVVHAFDAERPATLSPRILGTLLRSELGFDGVCFTDCLEMAAIVGESGTARAAALAVAAGADAVLVSHERSLARAARDEIVAAARAGTLPIERLEEAAGRMRRLRAWAAPAALSAPWEADASIARDVARAALRVVRGDPVLDRDRPVTIVSFEGDTSDGIATADGNRPSLSLALRRRRVRSELMRVALDPSDDMLETLVEIVRAQGDRQFVFIARRAHQHAAQRRALAALLSVAPAGVAVSALEPNDLNALEQARTVVCTFGDELANVEALADLMTGTIDGAN